MEQIDHIPFTRGGIDYVLHIGTDADGDSVDYIDRVQPDENGNTLRYYPGKTIIERDKLRKKGGTVSIHSEYYSGVIGGNGEIIEGTDKTIPFLTGALDIKYFVAGLGRPIMNAGNNGFVRHPLGFEAMPIFYSTPVVDELGNVIHNVGEVIAYTEAEEAAPPTNDYWVKTNPPEPTPEP